MEEISTAIEKVRTVERSEHDGQRNQAADWLDQQFTGVTDKRSLRADCATALTLHGGWGSFSDAGMSATPDAVDRLAAALEQGRSWLLADT